MSNVNNSFSSETKNDASLNRRKSDSNLLNNNNDTLLHNNVKTQAQQSRKRNAQMAHQLNKSISINMAERQLSRQATSLKKDDNPQEDTFYRALEIKFHHSVGSMSISPACRDVVLAG
jgi:hypothetical protein